MDLYLVWLPWCLPNPSTSLNVQLFRVCHGVESKNEGLVKAWAVARAVDTWTFDEDG